MTSIPLLLSPQHFELFRVFVEEVIDVNWRYYSVVLETSPESMIRWVAFVVLTVGVVLIASYVLSLEKPSKLVLKMLQYFSIPSLLLLPLLIPSKAFSFFMAVSNFGYCMTIFSESSSLLKDKGKIKKKSVLTLFLCIVLFNVPRHVLPKASSKTVPTFMQFIHGFILLGIADILNFLGREWVPYHISEANRSMALSLTGGLWTLCALEYAYWFAGTTCLVLGTPMSNTMYHHNPILSLSLKEFWGVRWNPIMGKQLQASFYKPVRAMGLSRPFAVIACFTGSALLHAIPKIISEVHWEETGMMFAFFFVQGVFVLLEGKLGEIYVALVKKYKLPLPTFVLEEKAIQVQSVVKRVPSDVCKKRGADKKKGGAQKNCKSNKVTVAPASQPTAATPMVVSSVESMPLEDYLTVGRGRFVFELVVVMTIMSSWYFTMEMGWSTASIVAHVIVVAHMLSALVCMRLQLPAERAEYAKRPVLTVVFIALRWIITLLLIFPVMPYFNLPMMSTVEHYSSRSLLFAPMLRAVHRQFNLLAGFI
ncbi:hypothetical protein EON65_03655 [archaeon]|nr:MAG: hypothetical protein EON65_03655 [archaeon]